MNVDRALSRRGRRHRFLIHLIAAAGFGAASAVSAQPMLFAPPPPDHAASVLPGIALPETRSGSRKPAAPRVPLRASASDPSPAPLTALALTDVDGYYGQVILARSGVDGLTGISPGVSINHRGEVAYVGRTAAGEGLFADDGVNPRRTVTDGFFDPSRVWGAACQINNDSEVVGRDRFSGAPPPTFIRRWNVAGQSGPLRIERGGAAGDIYDAVLSHPSTNNVGSVTFPPLPAARPCWPMPRPSGRAARFDSPVPIRCGR